MTDATVSQYLGILPMVNYSYLRQSNDPYGQSHWFELWKPGYSVFKFRRYVNSTTTDWGFVELAGIFFPMYDFCGGLLTSSPNVRIHSPAIETFRSTMSWHTLDDTLWRSCTRAYGVTGREVNRLGNAENIQRLLRIIPSVDPYLGPGPFTHSQMREIGERSIAAWLATNSVGYGRRGIFGADRYTYDTYLRRVLRNVKRLDFAWNSLPSAQPTQLDRGATGVLRGNPGIPHSIFGLAGAKYSAGTRYRNPNSGRAVSMCGAIMPDHGRVSMNAPREFIELASRIPTQEWHKLTAQEYINLLPAELIHNG